MQNTKMPPSKNDKLVGWIFIGFGVLGILYAIKVSYAMHNERPNYTIGLMMGGILIRSLIPLLFLASGQYYLSGKNAAKKAKKGSAPANAPTVSTAPLEGTSAGTQAVGTPVNTNPMPSVSQTPPQNDVDQQPYTKQ